ncbi:MAG: hypothetical protein NDI61_02130 [Bdellovibrionaceae bacterium]|nr:hypothetical protein [Pseudobdellovibrionaceae bacterium]
MTLFRISFVLSLTFHVLLGAPAEAASNISDGASGKASDKSNLHIVACQPGQGYQQRAVNGCSRKTICVEAMVPCKFVNAELFHTKLQGNAARLDDTSSELWAQGLLKSVMCAPQNGQCPTDRDACVRQSLQDIGCTLASIKESSGRRPAANELAEAIVMTGIVKAHDDVSVTVLTQGRTVTIPKATVRSPEYALGTEVSYEVTSQRLVEFFFKKSASEIARKRGTSSQGDATKRPPNTRQSGAGEESISFDE